MEQQAMDLPPELAALDDPSMQGAAPSTGGMDDETIKANFIEHIASLPADQKQYVQAFITPQIIPLFQMLFGNAIAESLGQFVNPDIALIPVPAEDAREILMTLQGQGGQSAGNAQPIVQQPQPQQQATLPPQGQAPVV